MEAAQLVAGQADLLRLRLDFAYDGLPFAGWARQPGLLTVQGVLEQALELVVRQPVRLTVAGRTDAGVHALHQVAHCDLSGEAWQRLASFKGGAQDPAAVLARKLRGALSRSLADAEKSLGLPARFSGSLQKAITVQQVQQTSATFDARFSALERSYRYLIEDDFFDRGANPLYRHLCWQIDDRLDLDLMNTAAEELLGVRDFLSFCKPRLGATTIRELRQLLCGRDGEGRIQVLLRADAFCHHMVRSLLAALVMVGQGKKSLAWLVSRVQEPVRDSQVRLAPARGLALVKVEYPDPSLFAVQAEQARALRTLP